MNDEMEVKQAYQVWSKIYDSNENATRDLDAECLKQTGLPLEDIHILELGAGSGKNTQYLASKAKHVTAMDFSAAMLDLARDKVRQPHVDFIEKDITRPWPIKPASMDGIVSNLVLEHIADLHPVFQSCHRALKPGGWLYLSELHPLRQLKGSQARFETEGKMNFVTAHLHFAMDYIKPALALGFELIDIQEAIENGETPTSDNPPRLLTLTFHRQD